MVINLKDNNIISVGCENLIKCWNLETKNIISKKVSHLCDINDIKYNSKSNLNLINNFKLKKINIFKL